MGNKNSTGDPSTQAAVITEVPSRPLEVAQQVDGARANKPALIETDGDDEPAPGSPAATGKIELPSEPRIGRRQIGGQVLFGLVLGTVMFFLFGKSGDEIVEADLSPPTTVSAAEEPVDETRRDNFGIGDLEAESRSALPRSDLPGATSTTLGATQQAPSTVVVEQPEVTENSDETDSSDEDDGESGAEEIPVVTTLVDPQADDTAMTTSTSSVTTTSAVENTTDTSEGIDEYEETTTTTQAESTTGAPVEEVGIVSVLNAGASSLHLLATPEVDGYSYCWTIGYETTGQSSTFCTDQVDTASVSAPVLGDATVVLEVYSPDDELLGTDTVTLEILTQSVLDTVTKSELEASTISATKSLLLESKQRPEITFYCWNVIQGDISALACSMDNIGSVVLEGEEFVSGAGSIRAQVYTGSDPNYRLVGSEEIQIEFE